MNWNYKFVGSLGERERSKRERDERKGSRGREEGREAGSVRERELSML